MTKEHTHLVCPFCKEIVRPSLTRLSQMESRMNAYLSVALPEFVSEFLTRMMRR